MSVQLSNMLPQELLVPKEKLFPLGLDRFLDNILYEEVEFFKKSLVSEEIEEEIDEYEGTLQEEFPINSRFGLYIRGNIIEEFGLNIPLVLGLELVIGYGEFQLDADIDLEMEQFRVTLSADSFKLRFSREILKPAIKKEIEDPNNPSGNKITVFEADPDETRKVELTFPVSITINEEGDFEIEGLEEFANGITLKPCVIGDTGVAIEGNVAFDFSKTSALQYAPGPAADPEWVGIIINKLNVYLPQEMAGIAPEEISSSKLVIGSNGVSGIIKGSWNAVLIKETQCYDGPGSFSLFGMRAACKELEIVFEDCVPVRCEIEGQFILPYFDVPVDVELGIGLDGKINFSIRGAVEDGNIINLKKDGLFELGLKSLEVASSKEKIEFSISGYIKPLILDLQMPEFEVRNLRIDSKGNVKIEGGWMDLPEVKRLDFYGFNLELSKLGFGTEKETGRRWIGINGAINLPIPAGVSVEGLRISWNPKESNPTPSVTLNGIEAKMTMPGMYSFEGSVSFFDDRDRGSKGFRGGVKLQLDSLKLKLDGELVIGRSRHGYTFFYIYLDADLPVGVPIFNTGAAIYGFQGLLAINMEPNKKPDESWYDGWYKRTPIGATGASKWWDVEGRLALGAGIIIGTQADDGFSINSKTLLILAMPGPIIMLNGKASFIKTRPSTKDVTAEGDFTALIVFDGRQRTLQMNFEANLNLIKVIKAYAGVEVFFDFDNASNWHLFMGMKEPENKRISVNLLDLFDADGYYMMRSDKLEVGAQLGYKGNWEFGPLEANLEAFMSGDGLISRNPAHLEGTFHIFGTLELSAFGIGVDITIDSSASGKGPTPWEFEANLKASLEIDFWITSIELEANIHIHYSEKKQPTPVLPLAGMHAEHQDTNEIWELLCSDSELSDIPKEAPVIPPDAKPVLVFNRPICDDACAGMAKASNPELEPVDTVGSHRFEYKLKQIEILRKENGIWKGVSAACSINNEACKDSINNEVCKDSKKVQLSNPLASPSCFLGGKIITKNLEEIKESIGNIINIEFASIECDNAVACMKTKPCCVITNGVSPTTGKITEAEDKKDGTYHLTVSFNSPVTDDAYAGGTLINCNNNYEVRSNTNTTIDLLIKDLSTSPQIGDFLVSGAEGERVYGQWLPTDGNINTSNTKFQLYTNNPLVYFRRNDEDVIKPESFSISGPKVKELWEEVYFDQLQGVLALGYYPVDMFTMEIKGNDYIEVINNGNHKALKLSHNTSVKINFKNFVSNVEFPVQMVKVFGDGYFIVTATYEKIKKDSNGKNIMEEIKVTNQGLLKGTAITIDIRSIGGTIKYIEVQSTDISKNCVLSYIAYLPGWTRVEIPENLVESNGNEATIAGITLSLSTVLKDTLEQIIEFSDIYKTKIPNTVNGINTVFDDIYNLASNILVNLPSTKAKIDQLCNMITMIIKISKINEEVIKLLDIKKLNEFVSNLRIPSVAVIKLKNPVTRVRVLLFDQQDAVVQAKAIGGNIEFTSTSIEAKAGVNEIFLNAIDKKTGWIDQIQINSPYPVIKEVWYDRSKFAWNIIEQYEANQIVKQQLEYMLYKENSILKPNSEYWIRVIVDTRDNENIIDTTFKHYYFRTGMPPMGKQQDKESYPGGGVLADLTKYIFSTVPVNGAGEKGKLLHYRGYDIDVLFNRDYVYSLYNKAKYNLKVDIRDNNGIKLTDVKIHSGRDYYRVYSEVEKAWVAVLNMDQSKDIVEVKWNEVPGNGRITVCGYGKCLQPQELHKVELYAESINGNNCSGILNYFEFTTSKYINFHHHIQSFKDKIEVKKLDMSSNTENQLNDLLKSFFRDESPFLVTTQKKINELMIDDIYKDKITNASKFEENQKKYENYYDEIRSKTSKMFDRFAELTGLLKSNAQNTEISLIDCSNKLFMIEFLEPINWRRTLLKVQRASSRVRSSFAQELSPISTVKISKACHGVGAEEYYIEITAFEDTDLNGYEIKVSVDEAIPSFKSYYIFKQQCILKSGKKVRINAPNSLFGNDDEEGTILLSQDKSSIDSEEFTPLPSSIAWVEIYNNKGVLMHTQVIGNFTDIAALGLGEVAAENVMIIPNHDGSRALILLSNKTDEITIQEGIYHLKFEYYRKIELVDEVLKENNITKPETTEITFIYR